jgi:hypothetical protein
VEGAISDAHVCFQIMSVRVFTVAFKKSQGSNPISLFHEGAGFKNLFLLSLLK